MRRPVNLLVLLVIVLCSTRVLAQVRPKSLTWSDHPLGSHHETTNQPNRLFKELEAIEIEEVRVEGNLITLGQTFGAGAEWLNNVSFRVRNLSGRPIARLQITLTVPQLTKNPQLPYMVVGCPSNKKVCLNSGEEAELRLIGLPLYEWFKRIVAEEKLELAAIERAAISHVLVIFEDGIHWSSGCVKIKDPKQACPEHIH